MSCMNWRWSQTWLPLVMTSAPASCNSFAIFAVSPAPPAAFSPFTIVKSMRCSSRSKGRSAATASRPGRPTTSPTKRILTSRETLDRLLGVLHGTRLADHGHLHLAGVLHRLLDLLRDVARETGRRQVVDLIRLHDDTHLSTSLDRERFLDALEAVRHALELLQALDVVRHDLAARARPGRADRVGGGDERPGHGHGLDVAVVTDDAVDDDLREAVAAEKLSTDNGVRALDLVV